MDIKNGKIRNVNRKLMAGVISFALITSTVVGVSVYECIKLEHQRYENFTGIASFEKLKNCYFIGVKNTEGHVNFYIAERKSNDNNSYLYLDLLSGKNVFITKDLKHFAVDVNQELVNEIRVEEYLYDFKMIENMYSEEDIKNLLEQIKQENYKENNKSK